MINFSEMKLALYQWASLNSGITTAWAYQNSPQPNKPFLTLYMYSFIQIGMDEIKTPIEGSTPAVLGVDVDAYFDVQNGFDLLLSSGIPYISSKIIGQREFSLTATVEGSNAMGILEALANSLEKPSVQASLRLNNLIYIRRLAITDLPTLEESQYKERAALDIQFRIADIFYDDVGLIEHVELTENYLLDEELVYTTTNIIPPIP